MITLKQLEAFYWAAELGGLDPAAQRLNTTQSAISKRLQELEGVLGIDLFDRSRRRAQITPQGERLLAYARDMLSNRDRIMDLSTALTPVTRTLRLGVTELTAMTWLPAWIQRIRNSHPQVTLSPVVDASVRLVESVRAGELDMAIVPDAFRDTHFEILPLDSVEYAWMCSPAYLDGVDDVPLRALADYTIIVQLHASGLGDMVGRWLRENGVQIEDSLSSSSLAALASLTLSGLGISYLPRRMFDPAIGSGQLRVIHSTPALPRVPYVMLYDRSSADDFIRFVTSLATDTCDFTRAWSAFMPMR
jgi:DNA-binding transcriptional LysR family regulator